MGQVVRGRKTLILLGLSLTALAAPGRAQEPAEEAEEPVERLVEQLFLGRAAFPQAPFELETTSGLKWARGDEGDRYIVPLELQLGLSPRWQLELVVPVEALAGGGRTDWGLGRIEAGVMVNLLDRGRQGLAVSAGLQIAFPAVSARVAPRAFRYEPYLVAYETIGPLAVGLYGALEIEHDLEGAIDLEGNLSPVLFVPLGPVVPVLELLVGFGDETTVLIAPGVFYRPFEELELGLGVPIDPFRDAPSVAVFFLVTGEWELAGPGQPRPPSPAAASRLQPCLSR